MTVLDAGCLVALLIGEPGSTDVQQVLITEATEITTINRAEVIDLLARRGGRPDEIAADLDMLDLHVIDVDRRLGDLAGRVRATHYHRADRPVSLADCIAVAAAQTAGTALATSDRALADVADRIGVPVTPIANSQGIRPTGPADVRARRRTR